MVAIALPNGPAFHAAAFAAWKCGATPAVLSPRLPAHEYAALIDLIQPRLVVGSETEGAADARAEGESQASEVATYWKAMCSGGSTGRPKIIVDHMRGEYDPAGPGLHNLLQIPNDGVLLNPGPLYHNGPFLFSSLALFAGCTVVGMERFDAEETLRLIEKHRVEWISLVPTMMHRIWSLPAEVRERYDLSSLKVMLHMAAPCPPWLKEAWIDWLGGERIWEIYAGTEGSGATFIRGDEWLERRGSVGRIAGASRIKAVREDGSTCAPGEIGELYFMPEGGRATSHYMGADEKRSDDGWLSIGDLGHLDRDGYVYLADRRTDLIIRGGANIFPAEVEAAIEAHPAVVNAIVVGLPCEEMGQRVHAIVEHPTDTALALEDLGAFLAERLVKYKMPESFEFTTTALRDESGKARRSALRDERIDWLGQGRHFKAGAAA
ncbi:MAG TPA: AMP-binding protein, partial [Sphingopyxis sp.]|nr:AMP-binding protein [Sphingopyxis sp.]